MSDVVVISSAPPSAWTYANPVCAWRFLWRQRNLILQLTRMDLAQRYRGSFLGAAWTVLTPLLVLTIYTFVFNVILKARWGVNPNEGRLEFALALFCGLLIYGVFSECAVVAPTVVVNNRNYVKKTVFPLEALLAVNLGSALARAGVGLVILSIGTVIVTGRVEWTLVFLPAVLVPLALLTLGVSWFLAALGVFVRDIAQTVSLVVQLAFFLAPIVYPMSSVPAFVRPFIYANPFTHMINAARGAAMWGQVPQLFSVVFATLFAVVVFQAGFMFFMKSRRAFADVL